MNKAEKAAETPVVTLTDLYRTVLEKVRGEMLRDWRLMNNANKQSGMGSVNKNSLLQLVENVLDNNPQPTPESVAVAFGEWMGKNGYTVDHIMGNVPMWSNILHSRSFTTSDLFTLFQQSPEYKALNV